MQKVGLFSLVVVVLQNLALLLYPSLFYHMGTIKHFAFESPRTRKDPENSTIIQEN